jgi:hypothetical protein
MGWENFADLSEQDRTNVIQKHLDYLLEEGVVVKIDDKYRLKTDKEIQNEIQNIFNS